MSVFLRQAEPSAPAATLPPRQAALAPAPASGARTTVLRGKGWERIFPTWLQLFPPRAINWRCDEVPIAGLDDALNGLRILHLSDFHFRCRYQSVWETLVWRIQSEPPDLILITGDFVDSKRNSYPALPFVRRFLPGLRSRLGCFGIVGNHDDYKIAYELRDSGVTFLDGKRHVLDFSGAQIELIGLPGAERCDLEGAFVRRLAAKVAGTLRIVMSHHPDNLLRARRLMPDLYLAGHTHGGQICLPGGWPIIRHDALPRRVTRGGLQRKDGMWMSISRGLGFTLIPLRAFCPPEVNELTLSQCGGGS